MAPVYREFYPGLIPKQRRSVRIVITLYRIIIALFFYCSLPFLLCYVLLTGKHRQGLGERFAFYPVLPAKKKSGTVVWLHASSVGEVHAAGLLISELQRQFNALHLVVTTMTVHGKRAARATLPASTPCLLAPLDVPGITARAIRHIRPDVYICMETELWPVLLHELNRNRVRLCLANGRISDRSYKKYRKLGRLLAAVLGKFDRMAVISERDRQRYIALGAVENSVAVTGNVKYDLALPDDPQTVASHLRSLLSIGREEVLVAGSTHTGEEMPLVEMHHRLHGEYPQLLILAPRHVDRVDALAVELRRRKYSFELFSEIAKGLKPRRETIVIVDSMGMLARLYGIADYIFCGGSLVEKGGHNLMEAAVWSKAVFYGQHVGDFHDAAELLSSVQAGYEVKDAGDLESRIRYFREHTEEYSAACKRAGELAASQQGSAAKQIDHLLRP